MLTACGDHGGATIPTVNAPSTTFSHHQTFKFTGKPQRFKVPQVQWLHVVVRGAGGAGTSNDVARGGRVYALIPASIDKELVVYVGGTGNLTRAAITVAVTAEPTATARAAATVAAALPTFASRAARWAVA